MIWYLQDSSVYNNVLNIWNIHSVVKLQWNGTKHPEENNFYRICFFHCFTELLYKQLNVQEISHYKFSETFMGVTQNAILPDAVTELTTTTIWHSLSYSQTTYNLICIY
jgi:hypothetical protein